MFRKRVDQQITGLEIFAIALGLSTFQLEVAGRVVIVHSDNTGTFVARRRPPPLLQSPSCFALGAEKGTARGSSRAFDHNRLIHAIWTQCLRQSISLWVQRVPTDDNLADLPSRSCYKLLAELGAVWRDPQLANLYLE